MLGDSGQDQFVQSNIAVWTLTCASAAFLFFRLYCRLRFSSVWWDDFVLTVSWLLLLVAAALLSSAITTGYETDDDKRKFFLVHHISTSMTTIATAWSKVSFAITLTRIIHERILKCILCGIIVTANIVIILGIVSIWVPACGDPRAIYRPEHKLCYQLRILQYLGGVTIVYGGVIDIFLALCPWFVIRKLLLQTREKIGLAIAMGLGILTGVIVILRAFFQLHGLHVHLQLPRAGGQHHRTDNPYVPRSLHPRDPHTQLDAAQRRACALAHVARRGDAQQAQLARAGELGRAQGIRLPGGPGPPRAAQRAGLSERSGCYGEVV
ncbi:hypothetical protein V490_08264 [Pseudogymnoascus sp. VKM F-3557]|nr:hypothetical protein V490_08264 [Pseudogymnoascus sp. VKM F-3557]